MKIQVTFIAKTGHEIVEIMDTTPHSNGFVPDPKIRAMALGWVIKEITPIEVVGYTDTHIITRGI